LNFEIGEKVKVFIPIRKVGRSEKLLLRWFGPYIVIRKIGDVNYEVRKLNAKKATTDVVHVNRMLPYFDPWTGSRQICENDDVNLSEIGSTA
jgi:hypothetical protein